MRLAPALILAVLSLTAPLAVAAAEDEPRVDCGDIRNTYESNVCSERRLAEADLRLNDVYKRVLSQIARGGDETPYDATSWTESMKAAQRAWLGFRDADCKGVVPMEWSGGTGTTAAVLGCMITKTEARTRELEERYDVR